MLKGYAFIEYFRKEDCDRALKGTQGIKLGYSPIFTTDAPANYDGYDLKGVPIRISFRHK